VEYPFNSANKQPVLKYMHANKQLVTH